MKGKYSSNVHATLLAAVGGYLLYLAWTLFEKYRDKAGEMEPALNILAIVVFILGGLGTLCYAWYIYRQGQKMKDENDSGNDNNNI